MPTFIETQFPIARLSAESYKERKANNGQTLTRLGKWWGRKPLILVRASILGMLMPASNDAKKDREIFLKILTMDDDGAWQRCKPAVRVKPRARPSIACPMPSASPTANAPKMSRAPRQRRGRRSTPTSAPRPRPCQNWSNNSVSATSATRPASATASAAAAPFPSRPPASAARPSAPTSIPWPDCSPGPASICSAAARPCRKRSCACRPRPWPRPIDKSPNGASSTTRRANAPTLSSTAWR